MLLAAVIALAQPWLPAVAGVCATRGMATAIDFQALMAEEKRKMLALHTGAAGEMAKMEPATSFLPTWQSQPDRAVNLASPRPPLVLEQHRAAGELTGVYYIPGFVSDEEAKDLVARIDEMPEACWTGGFLYMVFMYTGSSYVW